jgi:hypothetical protein
MKLLRIIGLALIVIAFLQIPVYAEKIEQGQEAELDKITPDFGYKYFSGYFENSHNHKGRKRGRFY